MEAFKYNLKELYEKAFGFVSTPFPEATTNVLSDLVGTFDVSFLGSPLQMAILLNFVPLPNSPLIQVSGSKNIITTQIAGRRGTVKELINTNDYRITIKGLLVNFDTPEVYPAKQVKLLQSICDMQQSIRVENLLLRIFNITQVVIESYDFPDMEGFPGVQPYTINAVSDDDPELVLIDQLMN